MIQPIHYSEKQFIIINDISHSLFYFFDFDMRSSQVNMEFEHFHPYYEIHVLLSPNAIHFLEGVPYPIENHDFVLLPPPMLHKSCYPENEPSKRLIINFMFPENGFGFQDAFQELLVPFNQKVPIYRFPEKQLGVLTDLINQIVSLAFQGQSDAPFATRELSGTQELVLHSLFIRFLYCLTLFQDSNTYEKKQVNDKITERIYSVSNYIHTHYHEALTLEGLARESYMSPYYLSHQFKRITGYTITQYIHLVRVRNCQFLLINTQNKITDIAMECGFVSFSQFNRVFRKFCGESPSEYRKNHAGEHQAEKAEKAGKNASLFTPPLSTNTRSYFVALAIRKVWSKLV